MRSRRSLISHTRRASRSAAVLAARTPAGPLNGAGAGPPWLFTKAGANACVAE